MGWIDKLKDRWKLKSAGQVVIVLIVFACTGFTILFLKKPLLTLLAGEQGNTTLASVLYYIFYFTPLQRGFIRVWISFRPVQILLGI